MAPLLALKLLSSPIVPNPVSENLSVFTDKPPENTAQQHHKYQLHKLLLIIE